MSDTECALLRKALAEIGTQLARLRPPTAVLPNMGVSFPDSSVYIDATARIDIALQVAHRIAGA